MDKELIAIVNGNEQKFSEKDRGQCYAFVMQALSDSIANAAAAIAVGLAAAGMAKSAAIGLATAVVTLGVGAQVSMLLGLQNCGENLFESLKSGVGKAFPRVEVGLAISDIINKVVISFTNNPAPPPKENPFYFPDTHLSKPPEDKWQSSQSIPDPLALDLDGNGIAFTKNSAYFDLGTDGFAERATWIGKGDGLLSLDINGDGKINNGSELFGDAMRKKDGTLAKDGFDALADYDLNKDGKIDANDEIYSKLKVWVDANGDGITDAGELKTLSELGIKQLNLGNTAGNGVVQATGEELRKQGSFVWENGAVRDEFVFQLEHRKILVL